MPEIKGGLSKKKEIKGGQNPLSNNRALLDLSCLPNRFGPLAPRAACHRLRSAPPRRLDRGRPPAPIPARVPVVASLVPSSRRELGPRRHNTQAHAGVIFS